MYRSLLLDLWTIKECTGRNLGAGRRTRDSLPVRCVREERAERSKIIIEGETVFNVDGTAERVTKMLKNKQFF